jgi:hypothetical protein
MTSEIAQVAEGGPGCASSPAPREHSGNIQGTFSARQAPQEQPAGYIQGTFREHSGNIQGTFKEHSVRAKLRKNNPQVTFREHSGRVEPTPVGLHPNCQKHLKKKKKKGTKVDAECNLQT